MSQALTYIRENKQLLLWQAFIASEVVVICGIIGLATPHLF